MHIANYWPIYTWPENYWPDWPPQVVEPDGLAVAVAFGSATIATGVVDVTPDGLAVGVGLGSAAVTVGAVELEPDGLAVAVAIGAAVVFIPGEVLDIAPEGLAVAAGLGEMTVTRRPAVNVPLYVIDYDERVWTVPAESRLYVAEV